MRARLASIIARHGQPLTLVRRSTGQALGLHAFLQPLLREREALPVHATPLGAVSRQRWLYIGPPEPAPAPGDRLALDGLRLAAQEVQAVRWRDQVLYCRCVLRREKEAAD